MHRRLLRACFLATALTLLASAASATTILATFEELTESDVVTTQYPGLTFSGALVLTTLASGGSLNEIDFPPHSGDGVAFDAFGPIELFFDTPMRRFSAYFTYIAPVVLTAFDLADDIVASASSAFSSNIGSDIGSVPNELLVLESTVGISSVRLVGLVDGSSFVVDDITVTDDAATTIPEPGTIAMVALGLVIALRRRRTVPCCG